MNPGQSAIARAQQMLGRDFEVVNYVYDPAGGTNAYADGDWTETADSPEQVAGSIDFPSSSPEKFAGADGDDVERDAIIYVVPDAVPIDPGTGDESRATEFTDLQSGKGYRAVSVDHHNNLLAVHVEEL